MAINRHRESFLIIAAASSSSRMAIPAFYPGSRGGGKAEWLFVSVDIILRTLMKRRKNPNG